jgi:hypothetical protein
MGYQDKLRPIATTDYASKLLPVGTPPPKKPAAVDFAIGIGKGLGSTIKNTGDMVAMSLPTKMAGPFAAIPSVRKTLSTAINTTKDKMQGAVGLTDENLRADNTPQKVGKGLEIAAEIAGPFAWSRVSRLANIEKATIDEVAAMADKAKAKIMSTSENVLEGSAPTSQLKADAEKMAVPTTFRERLGGLATDVKTRIQGKGKLFADYMNVVDARNSSDLAPSPLEYGVSFATQAKTKMESLLSDAGSQIGQFRRKISTYQVPRDTFNDIRTEWASQLKKLNLEVVKGEVRRIPGKIAQTISDAEIGSLQALQRDLEIASQGPSLENIIDLRNKFGNKINFEKMARDVSNTLDPVSRYMRAKLASTAEGVVGKTEQKSVKAYAEFMDAYDDLRSYVDRRAGGEFLLKRVFSERGGEPRAIMETIRQHTGIDLMDHALMAKIATELGGNPQMQGLFRQELTKAGIDAFNLLQGNPVGAVGTLMKLGGKQFLDKRKIFEKAANSMPSAIR